MLKKLSYTINRYVIRKHSVALLLMLLFIYPQAADARRIDSEKKYKYMAIYIGKFFKYVEWPALIVDKDDTPNIDFCIFGENPFEDNLHKVSQITSSKSNLKINIRGNVEIVDVKTCNMAFIHKDYSEQKSLFAEIKKFPILSITEESEDMMESGIVEFFTLKNLVFRIDKGKADKQNITISSSLLKIAAEVKR